MFFNMTINVRCDVETFPFQGLIIHAQRFL